MVTEAVERDSLFSIIVGPLVWAVYFLTIYITTAIACAKEFFYLQIFGISILPAGVALATLIAVGLILDGAIVALRRWRRPWGKAPLPPHDRDSIQSRRRFMAYAGFLLCTLSLIATLWVALPFLFMTSCR
jgi:multidrug efflux pump subunit AcrB